MKLTYVSPGVFKADNGEIFHANGSSNVVTDGSGKAISGTELANFQTAQGIARQAAGLPPLAPAGQLPAKDQPAGGTDTSGEVPANSPGNVNYAPPATSGPAANTESGIINGQLNLDPTEIGLSNLGQNANYSNAGGTQSTTIDPRTGQANTSDTLSSANQGILNTNQSNAQGAGNQAGSLLNGINNQSAGGSGALSPYEQAVYNQQTSLLQPQFQQQSAQMAQTLAEQGIPTGSQAYNNAMTNFSNNWNTQFSNAAANAQTAGSQQQASLLGQLNTMGQGGMYTPTFGGTTGTAAIAPNVSDVQNQLQNQSVNQGQLGVQQGQLGVAQKQVGINQQVANDTAATNAAILSVSMASPTFSSGSIASS